MVCPATNGASPATAPVSAATIEVISAIAAVLAATSPCSTEFDILFIEAFDVFKVH